MVSDLKTFAHKRCKIYALKILVLGETCLTGRIFLVLVLLSVLVERCFVSRMRDFFMDIVVVLFGGGSVIKEAFPV